VLTLSPRELFFPFFSPPLPKPATVRRSVRCRSCLTFHDLDHRHFVVLPSVFFASFFSPCSACRPAHPIHATEFSSFFRATFRPVYTPPVPFFLVEFLCHGRPRPSPTTFLRRGTSYPSALRQVNDPTASRHPALKNCHDFLLQNSHQRLSNTAPQ